MKTRGWLFVLGLAGVVVTTACGSGGAGTAEGVARPAREAPTTTSPAGAVAAPGGQAATPVAGKAVTPTTVANGAAKPSAAAGPPVTRVAAFQPERASEPSTAAAPRATVTPAYAAPGTRVWLDGEGFTAERWQNGSGHLWLSAAGGQLDCEMLARADHDVTVTSDGHLRGSLIVPAQGTCHYPTDREIATAGMWFDVAYQCTTCYIGTLSVAVPDQPTEELPGTNCDDIAFNTPDSNVTGTVYAVGLSCAEAHTFLREHAWSWGASNGPNHIEADGFTCDRTSQSTLPQATYTCTRGAQSIWFVSS